MSSLYKKVNLIITVPEGDYCWDAANDRICDHFDNSGGLPCCNLSHIIKSDIENYDKKGRVEKSSYCQALTTPSEVSK